MVKLIHTKTAQTKKKESLNTQIVGDLMLPTIEPVLHIRTKGSDHFPIQISLDKSPISQAILIKEKHRLRWLYNKTQDPNIKSTINRLQKEIRTKINQESTISWEKFCNSISL